jgi:hypothetical protein
MITPVQKFYDLSTLSAAGAELTVAAKPDELAGIAQWIGVDGVTKFEGRVTLQKLSQNRFGYEADMVADVVQSCVVTLEPVRSRIARHFARALHLTHGPAAARLETVVISPVEDDSLEEISSQRYDLAGPLLEELSLAIDPYPRAPGVAFETPGAEKDPKDNPFAVLKQLKEGG